MEKFALLNLLKALDGLSGKKSADENGAADAGNGGFGGFGGGQEFFSANSGAGNPFDGILGNLLKNGLFGGGGGQNQPSSCLPM